MKLADFDYHLPRELIAQHPLRERDSCRLMLLDRRDNSLKHLSFQDILSYVVRYDLIVLNDTKVLPCRIRGFRSTGGRVELLLLNQKEGLAFNAYLKPGRLKLGEEIKLVDHGLSCRVTAKDEVEFSGGSLSDIYKIGVMPLPPYIKREPEEEDAAYYQTVYASSPGAVAAPTAGLHFTERLIKEMGSRGALIAELTLHVGPGTFKPVKAEDITVHHMEPEYFSIPEKTRNLIAEAKSRKSRIWAVGTTSLRALEASHSAGAQGQTDLFIFPGYKFQVANCLLTNFHLPRSTLFMLVCAFAGMKLVKKAYQEAIAKKYRFYSYGDAMLII